MGEREAAAADQRHDFPAFLGPRVPSCKVGAVASRRPTGAGCRPWPCSGPEADWLQETGQGLLRPWWAQHKTPAWGLGRLGEPVSPPHGPRALARRWMSHANGGNGNLHPRRARHLPRPAPRRCSAPGWPSPFWKLHCPSGLHSHNTTLSRDHG